MPGWVDFADPPGYYAPLASARAVGFSRPPRPDPRPGPDARPTRVAVVKMHASHSLRCVAPLSLIRNPMSLPPATPAVVLSPVSTEPAAARTAAAGGAAPARIQ